MTHDSQWKHEAPWRDMEFADKLPEGRRPLTWADLGVGPNSTWEGEAKEWKAKVVELAQENEELRAKVEKADALAEAAVKWADHDGEHGYQAVVKPLLNALAAYLEDQSE